MEIERPPSTQHRRHKSGSSYQEHDPANLVLPAVPSHDLTAAQKNIQLPCLRDLFSPELEQVIHRRDASAASRASSSSSQILPQYEPMILSPPESVLLSEADSSAGGRLHNHIVVDDPAVRIAAEALSGLGGPGM